MIRILMRDPWRLIVLSGWILIGSGLFALALATRGNLLPHDVQYLGMTSADLCRANACRVVHFMSHDRVSFGGAIITIGILYHALAVGPLRNGRRWAWWTLLVSAAIGFASFLSYLGYGYLDVMHGWATVGLLVVFIAGMAMTWRQGRDTSVASKIEVSDRTERIRYFEWSRLALGRMILAAMAMGMIAAGMTIMAVGMTRIFVPQDLEFMQFTPEQLRALNPRLMPLIAHDRAGFGGGVASAGAAFLFIAICGVRERARGMWWAMAVGGGIGFACAVGVHPVIGYTSWTHLAPAYLGCAAFVVAIVLLRRPMCEQRVVIPS